ncbi:Methylsterol monooxygenase 1-1 [Spatholobus suberectus]|nr:Methylsterol monooxygenase 1-1 [Spatholobus suberectus]
MLPYDSIPAAEAALGRNLTSAETLWFSYSATKSDYFLYCHNILFLFVIFSLVPFPLVFLELKRVSVFDSYKIQPKVRLSLDEILKCYKDVMRMFFLVVGPLQLLSYPSVKMIGIRTGLPLPSGWEIFSQLLVYFLVEDYTNYWIHRFLHNKWGYEKIHRVHHEYPAPIGFAAPYAHWAEILILGIPSFLGPAMVPGHMITFWLWIVLRQIEAIDTHSGYDFPWSLTKYIPFYGGAEYHDYHHYVGRQSQSNFASVFTYCDYIYGTDKVLSWFWNYFCYINICIVFPHVILIFYDSTLFVTGLQVSEENTSEVEGRVGKWC